MAAGHGRPCCAIQEFAAERIEQRRAHGHNNMFLNVMFWCRSGHHRSVAVTEMFASALVEARALARSPLRPTLRSALACQLVLWFMFVRIASLCHFVRLFVALDPLCFESLRLALLSLPACLCA